MVTSEFANRVRIDLKRAPGRPGRFAHQRTRSGGVWLMHFDRPSNVPGGLGIAHRNAEHCFHFRF